MEKENKLSRKNVKMQLDNIIKEFHKPKSQNTKIKKPKTNPTKLKDTQMDSLQELIDYLRVCVKYTIWDLEATRRENDYLRKLLKDKNG